MPFCGILIFNKVKLIVEIGAFIMKQNQVSSYRVLLEGGEGEIVEKKSRFIATVRPVETEEEAIAFIERIRPSAATITDATTTAIKIFSTFFLIKILFLWLII